MMCVCMYMCVCVGVYAYTLATISFKTPNIHVVILSPAGE